MLQTDSLVVKSAATSTSGRALAATKTITFAGRSVVLQCRRPLACAGIVPWALRAEPPHHFEVFYARFNSPKHEHHASKQQHGEVGKLTRTLSKCQEDPADAAQAHPRWYSGKAYSDASNQHPVFIADRSQHR